MSNYTKATNFGAKDALPVGDANKKVKGVEIDNEFNAIANAVSTKADTNSPTFTGTPSAPTATAGTETTQIATTAFVTAATDALDTAKADLASPDFTGTPTAPTATAGTNTTQVATTAFVLANSQGVDSDLTAIAGLSSNGLVARTGDGTAAVRTITGSAGIGVTDGDGVSGNPTLTVTVASQAEAEAGTDNTKVMTALRVKQSIDENVQGIGIGQTWQNPSRAANTNYQNTTGKPIMVNVRTTAFNSSWQVGVTTGSFVTVAGEGDDTRSVIVPPNHFYRFNADNNVVQNWAELR